MLSNRGFCTVGICLALCGSLAHGADNPQLQWHLNYGTAMQQAAKQHKQLLIQFYSGRPTRSAMTFERSMARSPEASKFVLARLRTDAVIQVRGRKTRLLKHAAFAEMRGKPGVAIVDLSNPKSPHYRRVVTVLPFSKHRLLNPLRLEALLTLPAGSLAQRTLIFAVRIHPASPKSANGTHSSVLARESSKHSYHQASINLQGHHNWDSRFQSINARLGNGAVAQEVCAESWPGQDLVEAAEECVDSWRQSPGHWRAVKGRHSLFGYDMKRGSNGVWYATGIFARFRR